MQYFIYSYDQYVIKVSNISFLDWSADVIIMVFWIVFGLIAQVIIHESGHFIFGLVTGYRLVSYRIFSITLIRDRNKLRFAKYSSPGSLGQCLMKPPGRKGKRMPYVLHSLGGVILDAVTFVITLQLALSPLTISFLTRTGLFLCAAYASMNVLANGIPHKNSIIYNDGTNAYFFIKEQAAAQSLYLQLDIIPHLLNGETYRDLSADYFLISKEANLDNGLIAWHKLLESYYYMEKNQWDDALCCITKLENSDGRKCKLLEDSIIAEKLFLFIMMKKNASEIEALYHKVDKTLKKQDYDIHFYRVKKAYEIYSCKTMIDKKEILKEVTIRWKGYPYKGDARFCAELLKGLLNGA